MTDKAKKGGGGGGAGIARKTFRVQKQQRNKLSHLVLSVEVAVSSGMG